MSQKNLTFTNHTGTALLVANIQGARMVAAGEGVDLGPKSAAPWSVAFAEGAKALGTLRIHITTKQPVAETCARAKKRYSVDCGAEGFVACRLPSPT